MSAREFTEAEIGQLIEDLNRDGICILRGAIDPNLVETWRQAFMQLFEQRKNRPGGLAPREQSRYYLTLPWVPPFADEQAFANPAVIRLLDRLFPQEYAMVQLGVDVPFKGSDYQETHRDYRPLFTDEVVTPLYAVAVNFPLVRVTEENGPLQHARGTHLLPRDVGLEKVRTGEIQLESFPMEPGDVSVRTPLCLHRGTPNYTDQPRPMVVMGYVMHWLYTPQVELDVPRSYYESLPERTRKMLRCRVVEELEDKTETYVDFKY